MTRGWQSIFLNESGMRSGWRILIFAIAFIVSSALISPLALLGRGESILLALSAQSAILLLAALLAAWVMLRFVEKRPFGALGFAWTTRTPAELGVGTLIGGGAIGVGVLILALIGWLRYETAIGGLAEYISILVGTLIFFFIAAAAEEALFRGYPFQVLVQGIGALPATILASLAFSLAHAANPNVDILALINIFLAGIMLSLAYLRTRSLWFATAVHLGWNWAMASIFDLPVSGLTGLAPPLYDAVLTGPEWVTGGAFGPEGGVIGSLAIIIVLIAIYKIPGIGIAPEMRALRPLVDQRG